MTNFDPGGFLMLLTVIPAVVGGIISIGAAKLLARVGIGEYETNVLAVLGVLLLAWVVAAAVVSTSMLAILAVTLAMLGAYAATRSVTAASVGWVLGVVLLFVLFIVLSNLGVYQGVDVSGRPRGLIARHLYAFYAGGLLVCGAVAGATVAVGRGRLGKRGPSGGR